MSIFLRRLFLIGLGFPSLLGFFSVSYKDCGYSYQNIVADRFSLIRKNQEQLSAAMWYLFAALVIWGLVVAAILRRKKNDGDRAG
ncbi:MAG: hypothetical protein ACM3L8_07275 [Verrucomicrobiota bacterium]